jgi:peptide/nickel transport system substrate-binding protein
MTQSFRHQELNAMSGLTVLPDELAKSKTTIEYNVPITGEVGVFFRMSNDVLKDVKVRQALTRAVDQEALLDGVGYPLLAVHGPLLGTHTGYAKDLVQPASDKNAANALLEEAGWKKGANGIRTKDGKPLTFHLYSQSSSEYAYITQALQREWRSIGVDVDVLLQSDIDLQKTAADHSYDALLYGISLGADPDVFAYWHSSQADVRTMSRLNFSEYSSGVADKALEAGRTRLEPELRVVKYRPFLEAWRNDAPAMMLYQPRYLYITRSKVYNLEPKLFNTGTDRYANVQNWMIRVEKVSK